MPDRKCAGRGRGGRGSFDLKWAVFQPEMQAVLTRSSQHLHLIRTGNGGAVDRKSVV